MREVANYRKTKERRPSDDRVDWLWMLSSEVRLSRFAMENVFEARPTL
jgi:hypothetical protein